MPTVALHYYALLREQAGTALETVVTSSADLRALYAERATAYGWTLPPSAIRVAVNDAFVPWEHPLRDGDQVVFMPPVAGG